MPTVLIASADEQLGSLAEMLHAGGWQTIGAATADETERLAEAPRERSVDDPRIAAI